jgi:DNA-binding MarR family transcriptional regulator
MTDTTAELDVELHDARLLETAAQLRGLVAQLRRRLAEQATPGDFTPSQLSVLSRIMVGGPATITELAKAEAMRPQSMSAIISVLEAEGAVSGAPHPSDGRRTILSLTDQAMALVESARAIKNDWLFRSIKAKFTTAEQAELTTGVLLLQRLLEP